MNIRYHNDCLAACRELRRLHPDHAAVMDARQPVEIGSPAHRWSRDYLALNEAASAGGIPNKRADAVMRRLGIRP